MDWFDINVININHSKSRLVSFHSPLKSVSLSNWLYLHTSRCVDCSYPPINFSGSVKYLGIWFDSGLLFSIHLSYICSKLRKVVCLLYRIRVFLPLSVRKLLVHSLAYSVLRYGITTFVHCSGSWHQRGNRLLKCMLKSATYDECSPQDLNLFQMLKLPNLRSLFVQTVVLKPFWTDTFKVLTVFCRPLRHTPTFSVPPTRTRFGRYTRAQYVPDIFNALPSEFMFCDSVRDIR